MITEEQIEEAVKEGERAFWHAVSDKLPEFPTGDITVESHFELQDKLRSVVMEWVNRSRGGQGR